jgi:hypothetical protein
MTIKFYFDIETIPDQRPGAFDRYLDAVEPPGNYKKQETIDKWLAENAENVALENYLKTGLTGLHGEICSIAWAIGEADIWHLTRMGESETELLNAFWEDVYRQVREIGGDRGNWPKLEWVGFNCIDFDLRLLKQRWDILSIDGSKVWDLYREGEYGLITEYNRLDVYYVRELYRRMTYV